MREREQNTQVRKNRVRVAAESPALMFSDLSSEHAPRMSPSGFILPLKSPSAFRL